MSTVFVARQRSLSPTGSDTDVEWDSTSDTNLGSDVAPSPPSSDIEPNPLPRTPTPEQSPALVSIGDWSPGSAATSGGKNDGQVWEAGSQSTIAAATIPERFWDLLKNRGHYINPLPDIMAEIWALRQEWLEAKPDAFVHKVACLTPGAPVRSEALSLNYQDVHHVKETEYKLLLMALAIPISDEFDDLLAQWLGFLRHVRYDRCFRCIAMLCCTFSITASTSGGQKANLSSLLPMRTPPSRLRLQTSSRFCTTNWGSLHWTQRSCLTSWMWRRR